MTVLSPLTVPVPHLEGLTVPQAAAYVTLKAFLEGATDASLAVLRGYAGTGKTYLVGRLIQGLDNDLTVAVAAPTNKAVKVLREKILATGTPLADEPLDGWREADQRVAFGSIHALLGLQLTEREDGSQECKSARDPSLHKFDVVIVDECSMIGADLFRQIVLCKRKTRVLFVGDPAQLPPIEAREAESPTFNQVALQVTLSEVVRQAADNPIIKLSMLLRHAIEVGRRADPLAMATVLPPLSAHPQAAMVPGDAHTVVNFALYEIKAGRDARVMAFTNEAVQRYNWAIHHALHGPESDPFVVGERVILHHQCDALLCDDHDEPDGIKTTLITSEEAVVKSYREECHPRWPAIPARRFVLTRDTEQRVAVWVPHDPPQLEQAITDQFQEWRIAKAEAEEHYRQAKLTRDAAARLACQHDGDRMTAKAKAASGKAWAMRRAFAPLRHAYAMTTHKSQGSTFDTAIVDMNDLGRMRSDFAFNRGLYVAVTRPRQYLAVVVA
jgi:exodeoxyribonuclease-5